MWALTNLNKVNAMICNQCNISKMESAKHISKIAEQKNSVAKRVSFFQPKLSINSPNDIYEQEADVVAEKVMRMQSNENTFFKAVPNFIQRKCAHCEEEEKLQKKGNGLTGNSFVAPDNAAAVLSSVGTPLDASIRSFMEPKFGYDFSNVQIHDDAKANESSLQINALAYTHKNHIVFGGGQYQPSTVAGKQLLAHELTHVIQQSGGATTIQRKPASCIEGAVQTGTYASVVSETDFAALDGYSELKGTILDIWTDGKSDFFCYKDKRVYVKLLGRELASDPAGAYPIQIVKGEKEWTKSELALLSQALKLLTPDEANRLKGYQFIRQKREGFMLPSGKTAGAITSSDVTERDFSIRFWDGCFDGSADVEVPYKVEKGVPCIIHEIGHIMNFARIKPMNEAMVNYDDFKKKYERSSDEEKKEMAAKMEEVTKIYQEESEKFKKLKSVDAEFEKLTKGRKPLTDYSKTDEGEAFAEAFAIFKINPALLKSKNKPLYDYFAKGGFL